MKFAFAFLWTLFAAAACAGPLASVVRVASPLDEERSIFCTGASVNGPLSLYLTAYHCVHGASSTTVEALPATVMAFDAVNDLALLKVPGLVRPPLMVGSVPSFGDHITAYGRPFSSSTLIDLDEQVIEGSDDLDASYEDSAHGVIVMWLVGKLFPAMSGGPLVDKHGHIVSVTECSAVDGSAFYGISCGASYKSVVAFLKKNGVY